MGFFSMGMGFSRSLSLNGGGNHSSGGMGLFLQAWGCHLGELGCHLGEWGSHLGE